LGFKDQGEALKWVHENIAHFGGDPSLVTIAGMVPVILLILLGTKDAILNAV
jgi:hypothetical protein